MYRNVLYFFLLTTLLSLACPAEGRNYHIYGTPLKGTKFKEKLYSWHVPLRKSYSRLSEKQKLVVREDYPNLEEGDRPPYPTSGVFKIIEPYVREFRYFGQAAGGEIRVLIKASGDVGAVTASPETDRKIVRFVAAQIQQLEFEPGTCEGTPCDMEFYLLLKPIKNPRFEKNF